jgi:cysteinyl-tRNA synthetase
MYGCGPTVWGYAHIGNVRTFLWYDLIRRYLAYRGYGVTYVMNYTDVDDKIIERAKIEHLPAEAIAQKYSATLEEDMDALGVGRADIVSRATDHIDDMIKAIQGLVERGIAYEADGNVFFSVAAFPQYGKLSHRSIDEMRAGERVEPHASKRDPLDFALWKAAKEQEPSWESPWGPGRPGWHIECSVMATKYLGMSFDIHAGGADLMFPHHENEIAQAEALAPNGPFARHWMHAGLVQMESEKMSKSLGNIVLARDVLQRFSGDVVRYWAIMGSYRTQVVFSYEALHDASQAYGRWRTFVDSARHVLGSDLPNRPYDLEHDDHAAGSEFNHRFVECMDDDFNSAGALSAIHDLVREANKKIEGAQRGEPEARDALGRLTASFCEMTTVLGFRFESPIGSDLVTHLIEYLLELREKARSERAFDRSDDIRARLGDIGVAVEDTPSGPRWRLTGQAT